MKKVYSSVLLLLTLAGVEACCKQKLVTDNGAAKEIKQSPHANAHISRP